MSSMMPIATMKMVSVLTVTSQKCHILYLALHGPLFSLLPLVTTSSCSSGREDENCTKSFKHETLPDDSGQYSVTFTLTAIDTASTFWTPPRSKLTRKFKRDTMKGAWGDSCLTYTVKLTGKITLQHGWLWNDNADTSADTIIDTSILFEKQC